MDEEQAHIRRILTTGQAARPCIQHNMSRQRRWRSSHREEEFEGSRTQSRPSKDDRL